MSHAEGRTCDETDMWLDLANDELTRLRSSLRAAEERAAGAEFAAEGWENSARANERKGAEWMLRAEAAERRAEGLEEALRRFVTFHSGHVLPPELGHAMEDARALARPRSEETPTSPCGYADEGWEEFPCTLPAGHKGNHACTATVTLAPAATDKETPTSPACPYCKPGAPCYADDPSPDPSTRCPECRGRGWHPGDCHPRETCGRCDGTGRAPAATDKETP